MWASAGVSRRGHWRDRLPELQKDVAKLELMLRDEGADALDEAPEAPFGIRATQGAPVSYQSDVPETCPAGQDLTVNVQLGEFVKLRGGLQMHYRHMNQLEGYFEVVQMTKTDKGYTAAIKAGYITPEWDLMVYFTGTDPNNNVLVLPGIYHSRYPAPYHVIKTQA